MSFHIRNLKRDPAKLSKLVPHWDCTLLRQLPPNSPRSSDVKASQGHIKRLHAIAVKTIEERKRNDMHWPKNHIRFLLPILQWSIVQHHSGNRISRTPQNRWTRRKRCSSSKRRQETGETLVTLFQHGRQLCDIHTPPQQNRLHFLGYASSYTGKWPQAYMRVSNITALHGYQRQSISDKSFSLTTRQRFYPNPFMVHKLALTSVRWLALRSLTESGGGNIWPAPLAIVVALW